MATCTDSAWRKFSADISQKVIKLVWGENVSEEVFLRWAQGFQFTEGEPSALIQTSGGPCAVIAPIQAYILKNKIFSQLDSTNSRTVDLSSISDAEAQRLLGNSIYDVLCNVSQEGNVKLVTYTHNNVESSSADAATSDGQSSHKRAKIFDFGSFHKELLYREYILEKPNDPLDWYVKCVMGDFGVLSLLYSVILTYGLDNIQMVVDDSGEPLVHPVHGHGGQSLINLLLTGECTPHLFDGELDAGGLKLNGISKQSQIGFLTLMEAHRYVEVGWNMKSPVYPIWLLGSETHLTVLFSQNKDPLAEDRQSEVMKVVNKYDTEGNGFINSDYLADLMAALDLESEPEAYVELMKKKLDEEGLGIFLVSSFMEQFFPRDSDEDKPKKFTLSHYNGIKRSNDSNKIEYHHAEATLRDFTESTVSSDASPIIKCLRTKWPTVELEWKCDVAPSLN